MPSVSGESIVASAALEHPEPAGEASTGLEGSAPQAVEGEMEEWPEPELCNFGYSRPIRRS